ncbi:GAD-like domain-containing protein [Arthrobacter alpinus]|uniref:GAD-like domain-containing protein n=1 Tax=Arthrobacter alpinus TaxID=656366 RepID=A0A1H5PEP0_9MICC|nr:GAD-like domain-containing protein [Arthrobacter alpinus]SEF12160.1 GAD-like domain-containing protein [Arthrobacter alpinus]
MLEIADFVQHAPVEPEIIEEYHDRVSDEIIEFWKQYGYGTFGNGFIRVINPKEYETELAECIGKVTGRNTALPIKVLGLADLITWDGTGIIANIYRNDQRSGLGPKLSTFIGLTVLNGADHLSTALDWDMFRRLSRPTVPQPSTSTSPTCVPLPRRSEDGGEPESRQDD